MKRLILLIFFVLVISGCTQKSLEPTETFNQTNISSINTTEKEQQENLSTSEQQPTELRTRLYNFSLSCVGHCNGFVESGNQRCFCDSVCGENKNCCSNFKTACVATPTGLSEANLGTVSAETNNQQPTSPDPTGLVRSYPDFVKCSWITQHSLPDLVNSMEELKRLGLNSVCIFHGMKKFEQPSSPEEDWQRMKLKTLSSIASLKKEGFAIAFFLDAGGGPQAEKEYTKLTKDQFLEIVEKEALEWAKVAEEYKIEYFSPDNELPSKLHNLLPESERNKKTGETNKWHKYMLPKIKEVFKGKTIAKLGDYTTGLDPEGYDVVAYTISHNFILDLEKFRQEKVKTTYDVSISQSPEWWIGELWFAYEDAFAGPDSPSEYKTYGNQLKNLQDDYHRIIVEEINSLPPEKKPKGLVAGGYGPGPSVPTLTEESKKTIEDFFAR